MIFYLSLLTIAFCQEKVIYGDDDRYEINSHAIEQSISNLQRQTATMIPRTSLKVSDTNDYFKIESITLKKRYNLCSTEAFAEQISPGYCSGVLLKDDLLLTAGHCVSKKFCSSYAWVFAYSAQQSRRVKKSQVYFCKKLLVKKYGQKLDYALIQLDRKNPANTRPFVEKTPQRVVAIGSPQGVPLKATFGEVRWSEETLYNTNIDAFGGHSGSPVFTESDQLFIGIVVRGEEDLVFNRRLRCNQAKKCAENSCRGEDVIKIEAILSDIRQHTGVKI